MHKRLLAALGAAALVSSGAAAKPAAAMTFPVVLPLRASAAAAPAAPAVVQRTAIVCGDWGCRRTWAGRHWGWGWPVPWRWSYPPACPLHYHFACRPGPHAGPDCACWPNW